MTLWLLILVKFTIDGRLFVDEDPTTYYVGREYCQYQGERKAETRDPVWHPICVPMNSSSTDPMHKFESCMDELSNKPALYRMAPKICEQLEEWPAP